MKFSAALLVSALVAGTSATPLRVIAVSSDLISDAPFPVLPEEIAAHAAHAAHAADAVYGTSSRSGGFTRPGPNPGSNPLAINKPSRKPSSSSLLPSSLPSSLGALLSRLGFVAPSSASRHGHHAHAVPDFFPPAPPPSAGPAALAAWRNRLEDFIHASEKQMGRPAYLEGGMVSVNLGLLEDEKHDKHRQHEHNRHRIAENEHRHAHAHGHAHVHTTGRLHKLADFSTRLHRAFRQLTPAEALVLAFVLGSGLGSLIHLLFMVALLSLRAFRSDRAERRARREARREAHRQARRARKAALRIPAAGAVRLEGEDTLDVLPVYHEVAAVSVVEKA